MRNELLRGVRRRGAALVGRPSAATPSWADAPAQRILVLGNCQTAGIAATLRCSLPGADVVPMMWPGRVTPDIVALAARADVVVTTIGYDAGAALLTSAASSARLIVVPQIYFAAFHPDIVHVPAPGGGEWSGLTRGYHSRLVLWGARTGASAAEIVSWFRTDVFEALGYHELWAHSMTLLGQAMTESDCDLGEWYLPLAGRGAFMLTDNHPRIDAIVQLGRSVALQLGAERSRVEYDWERVIPDGLLATAEVWPLYPGLAERLGLRGTYAWRLADGSMLDLDTFVDRSLAWYRSADQSAVDLEWFDADERLAAMPAAAGVR
ncbi:MAG: WcbI family polysaccharide biosynthesis putative acetyltransferase [Acidimicrobiales bacterium]